MRRTLLASVLLGAILATPAAAAELLDVVVVRVTWRGDSPSEVELSCLLTSGEAVPPPMRARGATGEDFARRFLDHLERFDPQRAESHAEGLDGLFEAREFLADVSLAASLVTSGLAADEAALAADLANRVGALELEEGQTLEPLAAWVRETDAEPRRLLLDSRLWYSLDDERQGMVLVQQLAQLERTGGSSRAADPCRLVTFLIAPDLPELGMSDYYAHLAGRSSTQASAESATDTSELIPKGGIRFDRLFNPMDRYSPRSRRNLIDGYEVRKFGTIGWGGGLELEAQHATKKGGRPGTGPLTGGSSTSYGVTAGVSFDGYSYHPYLLRFGASVGAHFSQGSGGSSSLTPRLGLAAVLFAKKPLNFRFSYNKYRAETHFASDEYSVTDTDTITMSGGWTNAVVPMRLDLSHSQVAQSERTSGRSRDEQTNGITLEASYSSGRTDTELLYRYHEVDEKRRNVLGDSLLDSQRSFHAINLSNELRLQALNGHLDSRLSWLLDSGQRETERLRLRQQLEAKHRKGLVGSYRWQFTSTSNRSDKSQPEQTSLAFTARENWAATKHLRARGSLAVRQYEAGPFQSNETRASTSVTWERKIKDLTLKSWGELNWSTADETGMTGLRDVFDERHVLSSESTAILEELEVQLDSILVTSVDKTMTWVEDVDYRVDQRGDFVEISRIETGALPDHSVVSVDYVHVLELRRPTTYDRRMLSAGALLGFRGRYHLRATWQSTEYDLSRSGEGESRFENGSDLTFGVDATWWRFAARFDQAQSVHGASSYVTRRAGIDFRTSFRGIHSLSVHGGWADSRHETSRDSTQFVASLSYSLNPGPRWPSVEVAMVYRPFTDGEYEDQASFSGSPYEASVKLRYYIGYVELLADFSIDHRESVTHTRHEQIFHVSLRRSW